MGGSSWRSLHSVMLVTLHVAAVASVFRSLSRPSTLLSTFVLWVPLSIFLAVFLSWPLGRAISAAFRPAGELEGGQCRECGADSLRPLLRAGAGIFQPVAGYRCLGCGTTARPVDGGIVLERPTAEVAGSGPPGIAFLIEAPRPGDREGIRFLDDDPGDPA